MAIEIHDPLVLGALFNKPGAAEPKKPPPGPLLSTVEAQGSRLLDVELQTAFLADAMALLVEDVEASKNNCKPGVLAPMTASIRRDDKGKIKAFKLGNVLSTVSRDKDGKLVAVDVREVGGNG